MKVIAYIALRHFLFSQLVPNMQSNDFQVLPVNIREILNKLMARNADVQEAFAQFWDYIFQSDHYDAIWAYYRPDEITFSKCMQYNVNIFVQEFFGRVPSGMPCIFPLLGDFSKAYIPELPEYVKKEFPLIVVPLEEKIFPVDQSLKAHLDAVVSGKNLDIFVPYWYTSPLNSSRITFVKTIVDIFSSCPDFRGCKLKFRPKKTLIDSFKEEIDFISRLGNNDISIDTSPVEDILKAVDITLCMHSNFGIDSLRAGAELISYGKKAFYSNPQLAEFPCSPQELEKALKNSVSRIRTRGKGVKPFMPGLIRDIDGPLRCNCEAPYIPEQAKNAIIYASKIPTLPKLEIA